MTHWPTLRAYVDGLDKAGKLVRITTPVNKDTEPHPLVRLQFRGLPESQRKAFLFENVTDSKGRQYEMPVLIGALAASSEVYSMGIGVPVKEISNTWRKAMANPLRPREVREAACHEVVIQGDDLTREGGGLSRLPIPVSTPGFDNAPYTTASHWVSKNPDTGLHNLGNYRGQVKAENRIGTLPAMLGVGMREHIDLWRARGKDRMPAALVIGAPPHVSYTAVTRIPNDMCEYDVAGGLIGQPIDIVKCLTQDLFVPAESEIVIEGTVPTDLLEMEGAFGEFPGYMAARDYSFFMDVTAITMKKKPILLGIISQMPPSESSKMRHISRGEGAYKFLHNEGFTTVSQVEYLECAGANALVVIKMKKRHPNDAKDALRLLATKFIGKVAIAVDEDINPLDVENVMWAVSYRSQPFRDMEIVEAPLFALDPSVVAPGQARGLTHGAKPRSTALIIDATMPWPYPPLSLPKKQYMERAIQMWQELQLPSLNLKDPWWGYSLGNWTEEEEQEANLALEGRHFETGAKQAKSRRRFSE